MGTVFGSFFTLAVYRSPRGLDITHKHSFCPNCEHKLEFRDLIPIVSYISLKGKCRYCGERIRIRYLILEVLSGLVFLFAFVSFKMSFPFFTAEKIISFIGFIIFYITSVIILGIDKEYKKIDKRVLLFGIIFNFIYIIYLCVSGIADIYRYAIYLVILLVLFLLDTIHLKENIKSYYVLQILMYLDYIFMYVDSFVIIPIIIVGLIIALIYYIYAKTKFEASSTSYFAKEVEMEKVPFGFCFAISAITVIIISNFVLL
jgi:prepilin signal peptidase PulO-like enzyme (type II secretory pathway)